MSITCLALLFVADAVVRRDLGEDASDQLKTQLPAGGGLSKKDRGRANAAIRELKRWIADGCNDSMLTRSMSKYRSRVPAALQDPGLLQEATAALANVPAKLKERARQAHAANHEKRLKAEERLLQSAAPQSTGHASAKEAAGAFFKSDDFEVPVGQSAPSRYHSVSREGSSPENGSISYWKVEWAELDRDDCGGMTYDTVAVLETQPGTFVYAGKARVDKSGLA